MTQKFHERFNIQLSIEEARRRFVNRAHNVIIYGILHQVRDARGIGLADKIEKFIVTRLGERWKGTGCLSSIIGDDFNQHVRTLEALYEYLETRSLTGPAIAMLLSDSELDLGIRWNDGHFLPSGAPVLDQKLVNDVLGCLGPTKFEGVRKPFQKGLEHLLQSVGKPQFLADIVTDMYEGLEALAKIVTGRDKDLSANAESFIAAVKVSEGYKRILKEYIDYANRMGRHAGEKGQPKPSLTRKEVESFVYLTGLFIRLAVVQEEQV